LFKRYPDAAALTTAELEPRFSRPFFRSKSRSLLGMATELVEHHGGDVPKTMEDLVRLPGLALTANVVLGHALLACQSIGTCPVSTGSEVRSEDPRSLSSSRGDTASDWTRVRYAILRPSNFASRVRSATKCAA
jgi:hypothetical protein